MRPLSATDKPERLHNSVSVVYTMGATAAELGSQSVRVQDWIVSWRDETQWHAACGPQNLREALDSFLTWARR